MRDLARKRPSARQPLLRTMPLRSSLRPPRPPSQPYPGQVRHLRHVGGACPSCRRPMVDLPWGGSCSCLATLEELPVVATYARVHEDRPRIGRALPILEVTRLLGGHGRRCLLKVGSRERAVDLPTVSGDTQVVAWDAVSKLQTSCGREGLAGTPLNAIPHVLERSHAISLHLGIHLHASRKCTALRA